MIEYRSVRVREAYCDDCQAKLSREEMVFGDRLCNRCTELRLERAQNHPGVEFDGAPYPLPKGDSRRMYKRV